MKIACIFTGVPRLSSKRTKAIVEKYKIAFPGADFYYHTWDKYKTAIHSDYRKNLFTCPEPELTYHPLIDTPISPNTSLRFLTKRNDALKKKETRKIPAPKTKFGNLQILGYADAYQKVPKKYDVYIRCRWDTEISPKLNFLKYVKEAKEYGPRGFAYHGYTKRIIHELIEIPDQHIEENIHNHPWHCWGKWHCWLVDQMIFHNQRHFNPDYVFELHERKALHPIEAGWWQVLSEPHGGDIHRCIWNGVHIKRK